MHSKVALGRWLSISRESLNPRNPTPLDQISADLDGHLHKKTVVTMRQLHPSKAQRDGGIGFGAVELGYQALDKLAEHLRSSL